jgi:hypothetical protein
MKSRIINKKQQIAIEDAVFEIINFSAKSNQIDQGIDFKSLLANLRSSSSFSVDKSHLLFESLKNIFLPIAEEILKEKIIYYEFPFNLRVSHESPPKSYLDSDYPTDLPHCDPWSGEPDCITNFIYYVYISEKSSYVDFFHTSPKDKDKLKGFHGKYALFDWKSVELERITPLPLSGSLMMFEPYTIHKTVRGSGDIRISIDFRVIKKNSCLMQSWQSSKSRLKTKYRGINDV